MASYLQKHKVAFRTPQKARICWEEAQQFLSLKSKWGATKFIDLVTEILETDDKSLGWMKLKLDAIREVMDRCGLQHSPEFNTISESFTISDMKQIWREECRKQADNPQGGMVHAVDAEYTVQTNGNGHSAE